LPELNCQGHDYRNQSTDGICKHSAGEQREIHRDQCKLGSRRRQPYQYSGGNSFENLVFFLALYLHAPPPKLLMPVAPEISLTTCGK
jgi:hypothetical protein